MILWLPAAATSRQRFTCSCPLPREHFLEKVYAFSRRMNPLDYEPTYPKNPATLGQYVRKRRMEQGLLIKDFARQIGVTEDAVINWQVRGMVPRFKSVRERLDHEVDGVGRFLN